MSNFWELTYLLFNEIVKIVNWSSALWIILGGLSKKMTTNAQAYCIKALMNDYKILETDKTVVNLRFIPCELFVFYASYVYSWYFYWSNLHSTKE